MNVPHAISVAALLAAVVMFIAGALRTVVRRERLWDRAYRAYDGTHEDEGQ